MIDIIIAGVISLGFYLGYTRGIIKAVFYTLSLIVGIVAALKLSPLTISLLQKVLSTSPALTYILGVLITFIGVIIAVRYLGRKLEYMMEAIHINFLNKIAGGAIQGLFFAYILSLCFWLLTTLKVVSNDTLNKSLTYSLIQPLPERGNSFYAILKPVFKEFWDKTLMVIESSDEKQKEQNNSGKK